MGLSRSGMLHQGVSPKRVSVALLGVAVFVLAARVFTPRSSSAQPADGEIKGQLAGAKAGSGVERRKIGELTGLSFRILVYASPEGPRYTIISPGGVTLATQIPEAEVMRDFPGLDLSMMTADAPECEFGEMDWRGR